MPTYEYRCSECGFLFEAFQRIEEEPLTVCERCGGRLRKVFHPAGIVFKGSGFYATDSRAKSKSSSQEGGETKTESKPEKKKDTTSTEKKSDTAKAKGSE